MWQLNTCLPFFRQSFFGGVPILPESAGYGIVLGFGIFFSIFTTTLVRLSPHLAIHRRPLIPTFRRRTIGNRKTSDVFKIVAAPIPNPRLKDG